MSLTRILPNAMFGLSKKERAAKRAYKKVSAHLQPQFDQAQSEIGSVELVRSCLFHPSVVGYITGVAGEIVLLYSDGVPDTRLIMGISLKVLEDLLGIQLTRENAKRLDWRKGTVEYALFMDGMESGRAGAACLTIGFDVMTDQFYKQLIRSAETLSSTT